MGPLLLCRYILSYWMISEYSRSSWWFQWRRSPIGALLAVLPHLLAPSDGGHIEIILGRRTRGTVEPVVAVIGGYKRWAVTCPLHTCFSDHTFLSANSLLFLFSLVKVLRLGLESLESPRSLRRKACRAFTSGLEEFDYLCRGSSGTQ